MRAQFLFLRAAVLMSPLEDAYVKERLDALVKKKKQEGEMEDGQGEDGQGAEGEGIGEGDDDDAEESFEEEELEDRFGGAILDRDVAALETRGAFAYGTSYKSFSRAERARGAERLCLHRRNPRH